MESLEAGLYLSWTFLISESAFLLIFWIFLSSLDLIDFSVDCNKASKNSKDKSNQTYFSKQALKKNGRDYLNLDLDDGNGNAGKRILQKGVKDKDYSGKDDTKKEKKIDKINNKRDKKLSKIKPKQSTQKKQESFT